MIKIIPIFLVMWLFAITNAHDHHEAPTAYVEDVSDYSPVEVADVPVEDSDYTELYVAFANSIFDFFAKLVRSKVDLLLRIDQALVGMIVNAALYLKHWTTDNGMTVTGVLNTIVRVMNIFGWNENGHVVENNIPHY